MEVLLMFGFLYGMVRAAQDAKRGVGAAYERRKRAWVNHLSRKQAKKGGSVTPVGTRTEAAAVKTAAGIATALTGARIAARGARQGWQRGWPEGRQRGVERLERRLAKREARAAAKQQPEVATAIQDPPNEQTPAPKSESAAPGGGCIVQVGGQRCGKPIGSNGLHCADHFDPRGTDIPEGQLPENPAAVNTTKTKDPQPDGSSRPQGVAPNPTEGRQDMAVATTTGGEVQTIAQLIAELETVALEAKAEIDDAQADATRAAEDKTRVDLLVASAGQMELDAESTAKVAALTEFYAARETAAKARVSATEALGASAIATADFIKDKHGLLMEAHAATPDAAKREAYAL